MSEDFEFTTDKKTKSEKIVGNPDNILDQLKTVIQRKIERDEVFIPVPERPGVMVRISPNITQNQLRAWRKNAGEDSKRGMDTLKFACHVVAATCTGILMNDEIVTNDQGIELTFASPEIMAMTSTNRPHPDCVQAFFGLEPHIESAAVAIIEAAGYGDSVETVDPMKRSSDN